MEIEIALAQWQQAETALAHLEFAFSRSVDLYLRGRGYAPDVSVADDLASTRMATTNARAFLYVALRQYRQSIPLL